MDNIKQQRLFLIGAGGHAKVIADMAEGIGLLLTAAFDKSLLRTTLLERYPVHINLESVNLADDDTFIIAVGDNAARKRIAEQELAGKTFATLLDKSAVVSKYAEVEEGTVIMPGATINVDVQIGKHCIINTNVSIDHECTIEDYVHISPNVALAGNVLVGEGTHIGIGACVIPGINIGKWCTIGAGAVIIKDVPDGATVVGNPGRIIK